jgi:hypothetical protein
MSPLLKPLNTYNKPCFEHAYLGENVIDLPKQKIAQNVIFTLGYLIFKKNHNEPSKVAQWGLIPTANPKYKLLHFLTTNFLQKKEKKALAFNWDRCCHLVLCL